MSVLMVLMMSQLPSLLRLIFLSSIGFFSSNFFSGCFSFFIFVYPLLLKNVGGLGPPRFEWTGAALGWVFAGFADCLRVKVFDEFVKGPFDCNGHWFAQVPCNSSQHAAFFKAQFRRVCHHCLLSLNLFWSSSADVFILCTYFAMKRIVLFWYVVSCKL